MPSEISSAIIAAASGLLGVTLGGYLTSLNQRLERQHRRISDQLGDFYGPMLALRSQILAKSELRLKIGDAAQASSQENAHENASVPLEKILEHDNRQFTEELLPTYDKMVDLFTSKMHLAEVSTIQHFSVLVEYVEVWKRWLDKSLPAEVLKQLQHSEGKLHPFYEDLGDTFAVMQCRLRGKRPGWRRRPSTQKLKVLPSR